MMRESVGDMDFYDPNVTAEQLVVATDAAVMVHDEQVGAESGLRGGADILRLSGGRATESDDERQEVEPRLQSVEAE